MAFRVRKSEVITVGTTGGTGTGTARALVGLGASVAKVLGAEFKGITGADTNATFRLRDADGREVLAALALDVTTDDSTVRDTEQVTSTKGLVRFFSTKAAASITKASTVGTDVGRAAAGVLAKSPITIDIAAGTDGDTVRVNLLVETGEDRR